MDGVTVGLALSGGGAKGAYQVGVCKALHELGVQVDMLAGASIGALNGAVLASAPSLAEGAARLEELWNTLDSCIKPSISGHLLFLASAGAQISGLGAMERLAGLALNSLNSRQASVMQSGLAGKLISSISLLSDSPLHDLMQRYLDLDALQKGLPLHVSAYRTNGPLLDLLSGLAAELGLAETADAEFFHVQSLPREEQKNALLASAALPVLFPSREIGNERYVDGGLGGLRRLQGNTPIAPLLSAGCTHVIVTHLSDGSLWSRSDFPGTVFLEIRPQSDITRDGTFSDMLGFKPGKIASWIKQGYDDALHCLGRVKGMVEARVNLDISKRSLQETLACSKEIDAATRAAVDRLK